jgi:hypothetical protein
VEMTFAILFVIGYILALLLWYELNKKRIERDLEEANKTAVRKHKVH